MNHATKQKTLDDLLSEIGVLVCREVFDDIMDADTADTFELVYTFKKVFPDKYQQAVNDAIDLAIEEGCTDDRLAISGYEKE